MHVRPYQKLIVWKESYKLSLFIYRITKEFPREERFELTNQMRRAAASIPINIAEGNSKRTAPDKARFFDIAVGSLNELHCESLLAKDLGYITEKQFDTIDDWTQRISYLCAKLHAAIT